MTGNAFVEKGRIVAADLWFGVRDLFSRSRKTLLTVLLMLLASHYFGYYRAWKRHHSAEPMFISEQMPKADCAITKAERPKFVCTWKR